MATYYPQLLASRILNDSDRSSASSADDADVVNWVKTSKFILATKIGYNNKDTAASYYYLKWRNVTDAGSFSNVASTGEIKWAVTSAVLADENAVTNTEAKCSAVVGMNWQNGIENVGDNILPDSGTIDLGDDYYTELQWALDPAGALDGHEYEFLLYNGTAGANVGTCNSSLTMETPYLGTILYKGYVGYSNASQNSSGSVTVPAGSTFCLIGITYWTDATENFPTTITLDGLPCNLVVSGGHDFVNDEMDLRVYGVTGFGTGSKTFVCNWNVAPGDGVMYMFMFFSGVGYVHDTDVVDNTGANATVVTGTIDSIAAYDYVVAYGGGSATGSVTMTGGGQTSVASGTILNCSYGAAYKIGTGSTDTVTCVLSKGHLAGITLSSEKSSKSNVGISNPMVF